MKFRRTERMHSAVSAGQRRVVYVSPAFEVEKLRTMIAFATRSRSGRRTRIRPQRHETVRALGYPSGTIAVDEATPFFTFDGLRRAGNATPPSLDRRPRLPHDQVEHELALMQTAKNITLEAHKAAARVSAKASPHRSAGHSSPPRTKLGSEGDPPFNAVLFGEASAYPHGVPYPQTLKDGDMILIDTGAPVDGYLSDITRSTSSANDEAQRGLRPSGSGPERRRCRLVGSPKT